MKVRVVGLLLIQMILWQAAGAEETAILAGQVVDAETGDPLVGANVVLQGTNYGRICDVEGEFRLDRVPPGTYVLVCSMIGYRQAMVTGVQLAADGTTRLPVALQPEAIAVDEVVVEARVLRDNEGSLLRERQKAAALSDAISAEAISRSGSGDAGDAVKHVTGASIVDGKYLNIRGLGERYSTVQLNGTELPSADPDRRSVPMDLFPSQLLDNIVTAKSFTPDRPGSFTGGAVDLSTRSLPERLMVSASTSFAYNTRTSLENSFLGGEQGRWDWLAVDDGTRELPGPLAEPNSVVPDLGASFTDGDKARQLDRLSRSFSPVMAPTERRAPLNHSASLAVGNQLGLWGRPLGVLGALSYSRTFSSYDDGTSAQYQLSGQVDQVTGLSNQALLRDHRSSVEVLWGSLLGLSFRPATEHELGLTFLYNRSGEDAARYLAGTLPRDLDEAAVYETRVLHYTERSLQSLQLAGKHELGALGRTRIEWTASRSESTQDEPDLRYFTDNYVPIDRGDRIDTLYSILTNLYPSPTRFYRDLEERNRAAEFGASIPLGFAGRPTGSLKLGGALLDVDRVFRERHFLFRQDNIRYDGDAAGFFQAGNVGLVDSTGTLYRFGNYVVDASEASSNYDGDQRILAAYGMVDLPLVLRLRLISGVRYESTSLSVTSQDATLHEGRLDLDDWLPSVNLVYQLGPDMNLRAAYGRTLARPTFRELAPYASYDFVGDYIFVGNPDLERTLIDNLDLRWEFFPRPGETYTVSLFDKEFRNPIERAIRTVNGEVGYQNVDEARVLGLEFEVRKGLAFLAPRLDGLVAGANLTLCRSEVNVPATELLIRRSLNPTTPATRPLQGQSPFLLNLDLSYGNPRTRTTAGLHYNLFGRRLSEVSLGGTPDVYEEPRGTLDATLAWGINHAYQVKLAAKNLLDPAVRQVYPFQGREYVAHEHRIGRSFSVGLAYTVGH